MIRKAVHKDLESVVKIEEEVFERPWSIDSFRNELNNKFSNFYVYEVNKEVVGYIIYWDFKEEVEIANIAVKKDYQGMGIGKNLLNFVLNNTNAMYYYLEVESNNEKAIRLYTSFGFVEYDFRKNYYGINKHAKLMKLIRGEVC
ncbi:ribosomal protein S18-alanine N-acetyltransferase [Deferribacter thermophilus]|uniref:ribosomal protein S18-alanine N-acetyltransferase n=1 Tax=Deferribacter thermophilus TaxID=53573 RepID=UPI003C200DA5